MGDELKDSDEIHSHSRRSLSEIEQAIASPKVGQQSELGSLLDKASAPAIRETWPIKFKRWVQKYLIT